MIKIYCRLLCNGDLHNKAIHSYGSMMGVRRCVADSFAVLIRRTGRHCRQLHSVHASPCRSGLQTRADVHTCAGLGIYSICCFSSQLFVASTAKRCCWLVVDLQVLERIKDPLMTLLSRDHFETAYAVLCHFHLIAQRAPVIFSQVSLVMAGSILNGFDKHTGIVKVLKAACCLWKATVPSSLPPSPLRCDYAKTYCHPKLLLNEACIVGPEGEGGR